MPVGSNAQAGAGAAGQTNASSLSAGIGYTSESGGIRFNGAIAGSPDRGDIGVSLGASLTLN